MFPRWSVCITFTFWFSHIIFKATTNWLRDRLVIFVEVIWLIALFILKKLLPSNVEYRTLNRMEKYKPIVYIYIYNLNITWTKKLESCLSRYLTNKDIVVRFVDMHLKLSDEYSKQMFCVFQAKRRRPTKSELIS